MQRFLYNCCRTIMKKFICIFAIFISATLLLTSCKKDHTWKSSGIIVGWNNGYCVTCGGFYLNLSNDTTRSSNTYYVLNYSPSLTRVITELYQQYNKNQQLIYVLVDWQPAADSLNGYRSVFVIGITTK
jgi:hypothetical protein